MDELRIPTYTQFACIGTGLSGIALGALLHRWYNVDDICFFERHSASGGTWWTNSYPGAGCDVPSALYSYSFEPNPNWTSLMPSYAEIREYAIGVSEKYNLPSRMMFKVSVEKCVWREDAGRWLIYVRDLQNDTIFLHECQVLFSATGQLSHPAELDIPGKESFTGDIFHSARWDHSVSLEEKNVVLIGNGCTACQMVPFLLPEVKSLTQVIRSKHWIFPAENIKYSPLLSWIFNYVPLALKLHRFQVFAVAEWSFLLFPMTKLGSFARANKKRQVEAYMRQKAPSKYHELLIPDFEIGCKRRIFNCGYMESTRSEKFNLTNEKVLEIVPNGLRTAKGLIPADIIVCANGFKTNDFLHTMTIIGKGGVSLSDYWKQYPGPGAYNTCAVSGFPNFFLLFGPNSTTGHTSALMAAENTINYAMRILKPVMDGRASTVEVKQEAEQKFISDVQRKLKQMVWSAGGCVSWYLKSDNSWNSTTYPWWQGNFWWRCIFPRWKDWNVKVFNNPTVMQELLLR